jgi:hypothetical protein
VRSDLDWTDPTTLATERDLCPCGAPLCRCLACHGEGGWFDDEGGPVRCSSCRGTAVVCPNPECGRTAQKNDGSHAPRQFP